MTRHMGFFANPQGAAQMKHALLKSYLPGFAGSTGSTSVDNKVAYVDAFAGPGAYDDGTPGSPSIVVGIAEAMKPRRTIQGYCIEARKSYYRALQKRLDKVDGWHAVHGPAASEIDGVLAGTVGVPCFVFLDPFGIKDLPYDLVIKVLSRGAKTEALVRFDNGGVWRTGGHLVSPHGSDSSINALGTFCGGDWWQSLWQPGQGRDFSDAVLNEYAGRVATATKCGYLYFEVSDQPGGPPDYHMIHFASHPLAFWKMNETLSIWIEKAGLEVTLFDQPSEWVKEISDNIRGLLEHGSFKVREMLGPVLGSTLGKARAKHVREALKSLENDGIVAGPIKGDIDRFWVQRAHRASAAG
jgi:three-Cys-motif partner protein